MSNKVVCIHIGARAHYLLPRALESNGQLAVLVTDTWVSSPTLRSLLKSFPLRLIKSFANRYASEIPAEHVKSFGLYFLLTEFFLRFKYKGGWDLILARNYHFQKAAISVFKSLPAENVVFGISYTSFEVFKAAKQRGQKTILFQIDPGFKEENVVATLVEENKLLFPTTWDRAPESYWANWQQECELSDVIMVNSEWSKTGLTEQGIDPLKIKIIALPFNLQQNHFNFKKVFPPAFDTARPLRCLFLGTLTFRKGVQLVIELAEQMIDKPVEFILVGQSELNPDVLTGKNIQYKGVVTREETDYYYQQSDVFLFPTFSDGFGLTQLEAMAWQMPVIASKYCGDVVTDGVNGLIINECNLAELNSAVTKCLQPGLLAGLSAACIDTVKKFSMKNFADQMNNLLS